MAGTKSPLPLPLPTTGSQLNVFIFYPIKSCYQICCFPFIINCSSGRISFTIYIHSTLSIAKFRVDLKPLCQEILSLGYDEKACITLGMAVSRFRVQLFSQ